MVRGTNAHTLPLLLFLLFSRTVGGMTVKQVAVIGASGRLGRSAVQQLVDRGIPCKILLRKAPDAETIPPSKLAPDSSKEDVTAYLSNLKGVRVVEGTVGDSVALQTLVQDCDACLALYGSTRLSKLSDLWRNAADEDPTHAKQVNYQGVLNLIEACRVTGCQRIVRITGLGETPASFFSILINMLGSMAKAWNYEGELALRKQTDVDYTIIRPGVMGEDGPEGQVLALKDNGGSLPVAKIRYADVARLCIGCLDYDNAARATLTAMTTEQGAASWDPLLASVRADTRLFPQDMLKQHYAAVRKALLGISVVIMSIGIALVRSVVGRREWTTANKVVSLGLLPFIASRGLTTLSTDETSVSRREWISMGLLSASVLLPRSASANSDQKDEGGGLVSTTRLAELLNAVPTFTIVDQKGVPFMVVGEDAKVTGYFFIDFQEAKRILKVANQSAAKAIADAVKEDPSQASELINPWKEARISTVPLDFAVTLISKSLYDRRSGGNYFQIAPSAQEIDNALAVTGKDDLAEGKVPLFYYEDFTLPVTSSTTTPQTPLYFQQKQLEEAYRRQYGRSAALPPTKVTELFAVLLAMVNPNGTDTDLQNLVFVAPQASAADAQACQKKGGGAPPFLIGQRNIVL